MKKSSKDILPILNVTKTFTHTLDIKKVSSLILKNAITLLHADHAALFYLDNETKKLILLNAKGFQQNQLENIRLLGSWENINNYVIHKKRILHIADIRENKFLKNQQIPFTQSSQNKPLRSFMCIPLKTKNKIIGILIVSSIKKSHFKSNTLITLLSEESAIALNNAYLYKQLENSFWQTAEAFSHAIDIKDSITFGHSSRVAEYAVKIARALKKSKKFIKNLRISALLHDIGKIGISDNILKNKGKLTKKQIHQIQSHTIIGTNILSCIQNYKNIIPGILDHHERFDGKGYPNKKIAKEISLEGRIISIADVFDTLLNGRPYSKPRCLKYVLNEMLKNSGKQFDPVIVKLLKKISQK